MKRAGLAVLAVGALVAAACGGDDDTGTSSSGDGGGGLPETITVGVPLDTSGAAGVAGVGTDELDGVRLAAQEINDTDFFEGSTIELVEIDTKADKQEAVSATLDLVSQEVDGIVGFTLTPSFLAAAPQIAQVGTPTVAVGLSAPGVTEAGDSIFRLYPDMSAVIPPGDVAFLEAMPDIETAAYIYQSDAESAASIHESRMAAIEEAGVETVAVETFTGTDTDVRAQLTSIDQEAPDVVVATPLPGMMTTVYLQAEEVGIDAQLFVAPDTSDDILEQAGEAMQCAVYTTAWNAQSTEGNNTEFLEYWDANGADRSATVFVAAGYASLWSFAEGVKAAGSTDAAEVTEAMSALDGLASPFGDIGFTEDRTADVQGTAVQVVDGELALWDPEGDCAR